MNIDTGGSAFPMDSTVLGCMFDGMTLLDWFAGQALEIAAKEWRDSSTGDVCLRLGIDPKDHNPNIHWPMFLARESYRIAAAMIAEKRRLEGGSK